MNIVVLGAGPAGLSCAYELKRLKPEYEVTVLEASGSPGGLSGTFKQWDMLLDYGPHRFFTMDKKVADFWLQFCREDHIMVSRLTRIFYRQKFYDYPLKPLNAFLNLGPWESAFCGLSYFKAMLRSKNIQDLTFADWVSRRFGQRLYEMFFKTYSEKLWGIPCTELDADFAAQRIKGLNLLEAVKNAFFKGKVKHKTLVDEFAYPALGAGQIYERMAQRFTEAGGRILYHTPAQSIVMEDNKVKGVVTASGETIDADKVVSTMPITELIRNSAFPTEVKEAAAALKYRNTTLVYLRCHKDHIFPDNWIYVHDSRLKTGRITNFRNWSPQMLNGHRETVLMLEYWSYDNDALWALPDEELIALARQEMTVTSLVSSSEIAEGHVVRVHRSYPVYATGYRKHLVRVQESIDAISGLTCIGRNGAFKYNNQDHSILMGLMAAENLAGTASHNLWSVNTDYDYQEGKSALTPPTRQE